jgi:hypothetical protein
MTLIRLDNVSVQEEAGMSHLTINPSAFLGVFKEDGK